MKKRTKNDIRCHGCGKRRDASTYRRVRLEGFSTNPHARQEIECSYCRTRFVYHGNRKVPQEAFA